MKTITQERILKALEKSSGYLAQKPETQIYTKLSEIGIRSMFGEATVTDRDRLELAYHGFLDLDQIGKRLSRIAPDLDESMSGIDAIKKAWFSSFLRAVNQNKTRADKILNLQEKHNVSSLELTTVKLRGITIEYHEQIEGLRQTRDDFSVLDSERGRITRKFLNAVRKTEKHLWIYNNKKEDWEAIATKRVHIRSMGKIWAKCHEINGEFHLVLGSHSDVSRDHDAFWICATSGCQKPCI